MGDFNTQPDEDVLKAINSRLTSATAVTGKDKVLTFSTFNPELTLDYIFLSKHFEVLDCDVPNIKTSDHFPVTATVKLK